MSGMQHGSVAWAGWSGGLRAAEVGRGGGGGVGGGMVWVSQREAMGRWRWRCSQRARAWRESAEPARCGGAVRAGIVERRGLECFLWRRQASGAWRFLSWVF